MRRLCLASVVTIGICAVAATAPPVEIEPAKAVKADPSVTKLEQCQAELAECKKLVTALQRRLQAIDSERRDAQDKLVLLRDDNLRLTEELEAATRKGK